jgi:hypothetical protein
MVQIDQGQTAQAASSQGFGTPRTDAPDTHDTDMGLAKPIKPGRSVKSRDAAKATFAR